MSLYNMIHGVNLMAGLLLEALGLTMASVPRFRDCYWNGEHICVFTRTGGGNREYYDERNSDNEEGPWNSDLRAIDGFSHDEDDDYDSTYATFYYTPNATLKAALSEIPATDATPAQRWQSFFDRLRSDEADPQVARVMEAMKPVLEQIAATVDKPEAAGAG